MAHWIYYKYNNDKVLLMNDDDQICLCFRVSKRKIVNYCKREKPAVASLVSDCLSAGTGCGWCVPFIKKIHEQVAEGIEKPDLPVSPEEYARKRVTFRQSGGKRDSGETSKNEADK